MPQIRQNDETIEVNLPSYGTETPAIVVLKKHITVTDMIGVDDNLSDKEKALVMLCSTIKSWNLTDGDQALPVTLDNLKKLEVSDFIALMKAINVEGMKELDVQKKSN